MSPTLPTPVLKKDDELHGFVVTRVTPLPDLYLVAYELLHRRSGARVLHLHGEDPENLLAVAFRTPPQDDTGLPHILEHTVLCGSRKYPVKDPFVELLKTSLATFLNAMTYPDKTVYPCASMNEKDFFNLADVYCDAVFHPRITEAHFKQEGHHLDFAIPGDRASPLIVKGIVYNEMKGAYSDLDGTIERRTRLSICPDNAYGFDSGGDPEVIPCLTYEKFVRFHQTYYHPANSLIFIYGDIPTERHLAFLDRSYLAAFDRLAIDTSIAAQPRWIAARRETVPYPLGANEEEQNKTAVVLTFLACDLTDAIPTLAMTLLSDYLLGNDASPLRKALIDSKLGEDLVDSGYFTFQRDTYFTVGLKGTEPEHTDRIAELIRSVCTEQIARGLDRGKVEASFHRLEIASREIHSRYPLLLMERVYRTWLYDADPLHILRLNEHLLDLRRRIESEPGFLEGQLERQILSNPHYTLLTFVPDKQVIGNKEQTFRQVMAERKARMSPAELDALLEETRQLEALQSAPNPPEALATLPRLSLRDVPPEPFELATRIEEVGGCPLLHTDIFANGLSYLYLAFDLTGIDEDLIEYLPLYADALEKMGAAGLDYAAMAEREAADTGGVGASASVFGLAEEAGFSRPLLLITAKALDDRLPRMLGIVADRTLRGDLTDMDRLKDIVLQGRAAWRSNIIPSGNAFASLYAARSLSRNCQHAERLGGLTQLRMYDRFVREFEKDGHSLVEKLERIRKFLLIRGRLVSSFVGADSRRKILDPWLAEFTGSMREDGAPGVRDDFQPTLGAREGIATPAEVAFVAVALPAVSLTHPDAPVLLLLSVHLSYGYLWNEVRVKRGAYGARASYESSGGVFRFSSYRDPLIRETIDTFRKTIRHIDEEMDLSAGAVEQAVIGTLKTLDQPIRPAQAVAVALGRYLGGETHEVRRQFRSRLLSLRGDDIRRVSRELLTPGLLRAPVCVLSSRERLEAANRSLDPNDRLVINDL